MEEILNNKTIPKWKDVIAHEKPKKLYKCAECGLVFIHSHVLKHHRKSHKRDAPLKCTSCTASFFKTFSLRKHMIMHQEMNELQKTRAKQLEKMKSIFAKSISTAAAVVPTENERRCQICNGIFKKEIFSTHLRMHKGEKRYKCIECGFTFNHDYTLKEHSIIHTRNEPLKCHLCSASFKLDKDLKEHVSRHNEKTAKIVEELRGATEENGKEAPDLLSTLKLREKILKSRFKKKTWCRYCEAFINTEKLTYHMRKHTGERPFKCDECGFDFVTKSLLKEHSKMHNRDEPFKCKLCSASFNFVHLLKRHLLKHKAMIDNESKANEVDEIMSEESLLKCDECDLEFKIPSGLKTHIRIHTRDAPFKCTVCTASFFDTYNLRKHMIVHRQVMNQSKEGTTANEINTSNDMMEAAATTSNDAETTRTSDGEELAVFLESSNDDE